MRDPPIHKEPDVFAEPWEAEPCEIVTAAQMQQIEARLFAAGMPEPALMEKAASQVAARLQALYPRTQYPRVGVLVGPGHNGGDALVVARELHLAGYAVNRYQPLPGLKPLTADHARYADSLGIARVESWEAWGDRDLLLDGLFGLGLTRPLSDDLAAAVAALNTGRAPRVSIDLPSGLHTDTGAVLGGAIRADRTFCLGLWKQACFQDAALPYLGSVELLPFGIPAGDRAAILSGPPLQQVLTPAAARAAIPLPRPAVTHKYQQGHLLVIAGSWRFAGSVLLTGLGARASGVGMLTIAAPAALKPLLVSQLPEALVIACPETATGAIAHLPPELDLSAFSAIACGPGLTPEVPALIAGLVSEPGPLLLDADGLNLLAAQPRWPALDRLGPLILTPHAGEFRRLFPDLETRDRFAAVRAAVNQSQATVLLKGARTVIAGPEAPTWAIADSTPALARGGSGDVLTGLLGGLLAQPGGAAAATDRAAVAAWWHARAGSLAAAAHTELGVDPLTLVRYLPAALRE